MNKNKFIDSLVSPTGHPAISALILRVVLAVCVFPHGAQKLLGWWQGPGWNRVLEGFHNRLGIPVAITVMIILAEFFGSIALLTGCFTRFIAFSFILIQIGAIFIAGHLNNGFFMNYWNRQAGEGWEYNLLIIGAAAALMLLGGGRWSIDQLLHTRLKKKND